MWTPADVQMNHGSSNAQVQWFSHQKIQADDHDIIILHHEDLPCCKGVNYERRARLNLRAAVTVIWVFQYKAFGFISKPQTLYLGCLSAP